MFFAKISILKSFDDVNCLSKYLEGNWVLLCNLRFIIKSPSRSPFGSKCNFKIYCSTKSLTLFYITCFSCTIICGDTGIRKNNLESAISYDYTGRLSSLKTRNLFSCDWNVIRLFDRTF